MPYSSGFGKIRLRFCFLRLRLIRQAAIVVCLGELGVQANGLRVVGDSFVKARVPAVGDPWASSARADRAGTGNIFAEVERRKVPEDGS